MSDDLRIQLIDDYLGGAASSSQMAELEQAILGSTEFREQFWDRVRWHERVRKFCIGPQVAKLAEELVGTDHSLSLPTGDRIESQTAALRAEGKAEGGEAAPASPVLGFLGNVVDYVSHSRMLMFWLMFAVLGTFFVAHFGSLMLSRFWAQRNEQIVQNGGGAGQHPGGPAERPEVPAGKVVARLTNAIDCKWNSPSGANGARQPQPIEFALETEFSAGRQLNLAAGLAELTFDSGAKVILHAPAQFVVSEALRGDLQLGRLTARVPHSAHGFTIATPGGKVVDLGTEFGVKVRDDGIMNVIVYVGDVKIESGTGGGTGSGGADQPNVVHVHAGQAVTVGPDHIAKPIPPENERFVRDLAPLGDKTKAEAAYVEFMKSLKPVVWFRMESKDTERVLHNEMGGPDAKLAWDGPGNPFVKGRIGKGLWLRGEQLKDHAILSDYQKSEHGRLSVSAWAYADSRPAWASIVKNWGHSRIGQFHFGLRGDEGGHSAELLVCIWQPNETSVNLSEGVGRPFPLYEWQHVAFTADGSTLRLYRQGREVAVTKYAGIRFPVACPALAIGAKTGDDFDKPDAAQPGYWDGKLDEIAIFNDTLSAEDIRKLAGSAPR